MLKGQVHRKGTLSLREASGGLAAGLLGSLGSPPLRVRCGAKPGICRQSSDSNSKRPSRNCHCNALSLARAPSAEQVRDPRWHLLKQAIHGAQFGTPLRRLITCLFAIHRNAGIGMEQHAIGLIHDPANHD